MIELRDVSRTFTLHCQGGAVIDVIGKVFFSVAASECAALTGHSEWGNPR